MESLDHRDFLGIGWSYPVATDPLKGDIELARYDRDVKQAIRIILETSPGERVMRPDFGCGAHDMVFETINATTLFAVETAVRESLIRYEPRIELLEVAVDPIEALNGLLYICIRYRVRRTNQEDNLVYPFYFREAGER